MEAKKKKRAANYSKTKGGNAEREFAKRFRELGFDFCKTARLASRLLDNSDVDLSGLPFNVQVKSGYKSNRLKPEEIFKAMKEALALNFPPGDQVHSLPKVLIHKLDSYKEENELVTMTWKDWVEFLKAYKQIKNL